MLKYEISQNQYPARYVVAGHMFKKPFGSTKLKHLLNLSDVNDLGNGILMFVSIESILIMATYVWSRMMQLMIITLTSSTPMQQQSIFQVPAFVSTDASSVMTASSSSMQTPVTDKNSRKRSQPSSQLSSSQQTKRSRT
jgi:hypothetical protein